MPSPSPVAIADAAGDSFHPAAAGVRQAVALSSMTNDFVEDLLEACEKEGKRCIVCVMEEDLSACVVSSISLEGDKVAKEFSRAMSAAMDSATGGGWND
jgi:hypothetical protein